MPCTEAKHNFVHRVEAVGNGQKKRDIALFSTIFDACEHNRQNGAKLFIITKLVQFML